MHNEKKIRHKISWLAYCLAPRVMANRATRRFKEYVKMGVITKIYTSFIPRVVLIEGMA